MSLPAGPQVDTVLSRSRDPLGTANTRAMIWDLFTRLQWAVNAEIEDVVESASLPLNSRQCVYAINANLPNAQKVLAVRDGVRDLYPMEFGQLRGLDRRWFRRFRDSLRWFALCGYDLLLVGPPMDTLQSATAVSVLYNKVNAPITSDASTFEIQDENVHCVMLLTEAILLAKARDWAGAQQALQASVRELKMERVALRNLDVGVEPETE